LQSEKWHAEPQLAGPAARLRPLGFGGAAAFTRFASEGWWCAQSYTNRSPCYLPNIRVILEKNSEPSAENYKNACNTGIFRRSREFDIREEQGAPNCPNTERAFAKWEAGNSAFWPLRTGLSERSGWHFRLP
jgi:hypothetical protein